MLKMKQPLEAAFSLILLLSQLQGTASQATCDHTGQFENANYTSAITGAAQGDVFTITCFSGYVNTGATMVNQNTFTIRCADSSIWLRNPEDGACMMDIDECAGTPTGATNNCAGADCTNTEGGFECDTADLVCGDPGDYENAWHEQVLGVGNDGPITVYCHDGWTVTGSSAVSFELTCETDSSWTLPSAAACDEDVNECETNCTGPGEVCVNVPGSYYCWCEDGYSWENGATGLAGGGCVARNCSAISPPENSSPVDVPSPWYPGNSSLYECNDGYEVAAGHTDPDDLAQFSVTCMDDGNTCGCSVPICKPIDCGEAPNDPNSFHSDPSAVDTTFDSVLTYTCYRGYTTSVDSNEYTRTCGPDGIWITDPLDEWCSEDVDECQTNCTGDFEICINTIGSYYCLCDKGWLWNLSLPIGECVPKICSLLPLVANATPNAGGPPPVTYRSDVTYTCDAGFNPSHGANFDDPRSFNLTCKDDWDFEGPRIPNCEPISCDDPGHDPYSFHHQGNTTYGSVISYECLPGFHKWDDAGTAYDIEYSKECLGTGEWSEPVYYCEDIDECALPVPHCPAEGEICHNIPGSAFCLCEINYIRINQTCLPLICDSPPVLEGTEESPRTDGNTQGNTANYTCLEGYSTCCNNENLITLTCFDGYWMPYDAKGCTKIKCEDPGLIAHAFRDGETFEYGDTVNYTCDIGFYRNDDIDEYRFDTTCQEDGSWTRFNYECLDIDECALGNHNCTGEGMVCHNIPAWYMCICNESYIQIEDTCEPIVCGVAPALENTETALVTSNLEGSLANYTCSEGYVTCCNGNPNFSLTCKNGRWEPKSAGCRRLSCGDPGVVAQAHRFGNSYWYEDEMTYECKTGFHRGDSLTTFSITCEANGNWTEGYECEDTDECADAVNPCGDLHTCINTYGSYSCECADRFFLTSLTNCTAIPDPEPVDEIIPKCGDAPLLDDAILISNDSFEANYECETGYWRPPYGEEEFTIKCIVGNWTECDGCKKKSCGDPGIVANGDRSLSGFRYLDVVTYQCKAGSVSSENASATSFTRTCEESGEWNNMDVFCEDIDECATSPCGPAGSEPHQCENTQGSFECVCARGFMLIGRNKCFNPDVVDSGPVGCSAGPPDIGEAEVGYYDGGDSVEYVCNEGYSFPENATMTNFTLECVDDLWQPEVTKCQPIRCDDPGVVSHASREESGFWFEDEVVYTCEVGFHSSLDRDQQSFTRQCLGNGMWSNVDVDCEDINECEEEPIEYLCGNVSDSTEVEHNCTNLPGSYSCICAEGYMLSGKTKCVALNQVAEDGIDMIVTACGVYTLLGLCGNGTCNYTDLFDEQRFSDEEDQKKKPICICNEGWKGRWCDEEAGEDIDWAMVLSVLGLSLLCLLTTMLVCCCCVVAAGAKRPSRIRKKKRAKNRRRSFESDHGHESTAGPTIHRMAPTSNVYNVIPAVRGPSN